MISRLEISKQDQKPILLTFDDGPSRHLDELLTILQKHNVKSLFFWQGKLIHSKRPWKRLLDEGHMIGSHTFKHPVLDRLSKEEQKKEILHGLRRIESITGQKVRFFRPPFGRYNQDTLDILQELNIKPMLWHVAAVDWELKNSPDKIINNILENVGSGSIILLHELRHTIKVVDQIIEQLKEQGYCFVLPNENNWY